MKYMRPWLMPTRATNGLKDRPKGYVIPHAPTPPEPYSSSVRRSTWSPRLSCAHCATSEPSRSLLVHRQTTPSYSTVCQVSPSSPKSADEIVFGAAYLIGKLPTTAYGKGGLIHDRDAVKIIPSHVGASVEGAKFVTGACARSHCLLVDDQGEVWGCGNNIVGQLGLVCCKTTLSQAMSTNGLANSRIGRLFHSDKRALGEG
jgi:hypothetical protein